MNYGARGRAYRTQTLLCSPNIHSLFAHFHQQPLVLTNSILNSIPYYSNFLGRDGREGGLVARESGHIQCPINFSASPILPKIGFSLWAQEKAISLMPSA